MSVSTANPNKSTKFKTLPCDTQRPISKSAMRKVKILKKFKEISSVDESIEKDFLYENGDPVHFLDPKRDRYEKLGYVRLDGFGERKKKMQSLGSLLRVDNGQKASISRQNFDALRSGKSGSPFKKNFEKHDLVLSSNEPHSLKRTKEIQEKYSSKRNNFVYSRKFGSQERSIKRFDVVKGKWKQIENGLMQKLNKRQTELLNNKKKLEFEKMSNKLPSWTTTLRSDPFEKKFFEFIPVGNKLSGIFVRDIVNQSIQKSRSVPDIKLNDYSNPSIGSYK